MLPFNAITHLLPRSQHCREHQAGEGQQQTQCPGQIVTPLRHWSESSPFQPVNDVETTAVTRPCCLVMDAFLPLSLQIKLFSLRCLINIPPLSNQKQIVWSHIVLNCWSVLLSYDHICLDYRFFVCVFILQNRSGRWQQVCALQHKKIEGHCMKNAVRTKTQRKGERDKKRNQKKMLEV